MKGLVNLGWHILIVFKGASSTTHTSQEDKLDHCPLHTCSTLHNLWHIVDAQYNLLRK